MTQRVYHDIAVFGALLWRGGGIYLYTYKCTYAYNYFEAHDVEVSHSVVLHILHPDGSRSPALGQANGRSKKRRRLDLLQQVFLDSWPATASEEVRIRGDVTLIDVGMLCVAGWSSARNQRKFYEHRAIFTAWRLRSGN